MNPTRADLVSERIDRVRALIGERSGAGALLRSRRNFSWLTLGGVNHVVLSSENGVVPLVITARHVVALAPVNEAARVADEELSDLPIEVRPIPWHADLGAAARAIAGQNLLLNDGDLEPALIDDRSRLGPIERDRMAELGSLAATAVTGALEAMMPGDTEDDAVAAVLARVSERGARAPVLLAAADERIDRYRHPLPAGARAHRRLMLVLVVERWGLHAAITQIRELEPPDAELERRRQASAQVLAVMNDATRPGATLGGVLQAGIDAYRETGFADEWELHHQGGSIGYQGRERVAVPDDPTAIEPSMAFAWNPSITGAKAEETIVLEPDGSRRILTHSPTD
jgi:Xaa-Pro aminopeptidase